MVQVNVIYHKEGNSWWADSEDVPGFSVAAESLAEARVLVRSGLAFYFEGGDAHDIDVREALEHGTKVWVEETRVGYFGPHSYVPSRLPTSVPNDVGTPAPGVSTHGNKVLVTA